jgi:hypothetical protein
VTRSSLAFRHLTLPCATPNGTVFPTPFMAGMARRRTSSQPSAPTSHRRSLVSRTFKRPVDASQIATRQRAQQLGRPQWRWSTIGRSLSLDAKRSILINWTWIEHLIDQVPDESISKDSRPSRLKEVEEALLDLQRHAA